MNNEDLYWLAGLVEGEGCFTVNRSRTTPYPRFVIKMVDEDIIARVAKLLGLKYRFQHNPSRKAAGYQPVYVVETTGVKARAIMEMLYPLMGQRRQARIDEILRG